jgi:hypothetical protein
MRSIYATVAACEVVAGGNIPPYQEALIIDNGRGERYSRYIYTPASSASDASKQLVLTPSGSVGRWLRADPVVDLKAPYVFDTANNSVLFTVPVGFRLQILRPLNEVTTEYDGNDAGRLGLDASTSASPGDLFETTGLEIVGFRPGVVGPALTPDGVVALVAGDTIRHNLIVAGLTAGAGFWHIPCQLLAL